MSVRRYIYDRETDSMVEITEPQERRSTSWQVMPDIGEYTSMIDGTRIVSRSQHREHLRQHGCDEVGNDSSLKATPKPLKSPPGLKEKLIAASHKHLRYS